MTQAKQRFSSFEEYLSYDDGTDKLYELFNGVLVELSPESGKNVQIANRLFFHFALFLGTDRVRGQGLELEMRGEPKNRYPDLTIIREEHVLQLELRNTIRLKMALPMLVVEIVSPGELQQERDYIAKRQQYQEIGIPEYWVIDPTEAKIILFQLVDNHYEGLELHHNDLIQSPTFPQLQLTVDQVLGVADSDMTTSS